MNLLFEEDGAFKTGTVLTDNESTLQVETPHGKRLKLKSSHVLLRFTQPAAGELLERAETEAADLPQRAWAMVMGIAARVLEVAIHKAHALHFPLENILDGTGTTPIAPPFPDFVKAMGRTNDAIIYGGRIHLFVKGPDSDAKRLADNLPSNTCSALVPRIEPAFETDS